MNDNIYVFDGESKSFITDSIISSLILIEIIKISTNCHYLILFYECWTMQEDMKHKQEV